MPDHAQLLVPIRHPTRVTMDVIAAHEHAGRLERCRRCGREVWTAFGRARLHRRYCRRQDWPFGKDGRP